jgi:hypothetical protein
MEKAISRGGDVCECIDLVAGDSLQEWSYSFEVTTVANGNVLFGTFFKSLLNLDFKKSTVVNSGIVGIFQNLRHGCVGLQIPGKQAGNISLPCLAFYYF